MRGAYALLTLTFVLILVSCKKDNVQVLTNPPGQTVKHILLKDITIPNLPSPYYHFEYNLDSSVSKADFASGFTIYDVLYNDNRISEMRNTTIANHDTLRYLYDNAGKLAMIKFINQSNVIYRHVTFSYEGGLIKEIGWDHKEGNADFLTDRTVTFTFYPDSNVKTITDHRPATTGITEETDITTFEKYDKGVNVDDFGLVHDGIHDHLFLLQGFRLQENNPGKETLSVNGVNFYTVDYTYTYNSDKTPSAKTGDLLFLSGADAGKRFVTNSFYSYY